MITADQGADFEQDNDDADAAHESRHHREGHHDKVPTEFQFARNNLQKPSQHHRGKGDRHAIGRVLCDGLRQNRRHHHRHRPCGARHLAWGSTKQGREESDRDRTVQAGSRSRAGGNTKSKRQR